MLRNKVLTFPSNLIKNLYRLNTLNLHTRALINNEWLDSSDSATFPVFNPANGCCLAEVPDLTASDVDRAIEAAHSSFVEPTEAGALSWSNSDVVYRSALLEKLHSLIGRDHNQLAALITDENGKSLGDARGEVAYANEYIKWFAGECRRQRGHIEPCANPTRQRLFTFRQPIGPIAVISPWNFPLAMITRKLGALLAAGCTAVVKPSEETPLTALHLAALLVEANFPPATVNFVTASRRNAARVGGQFTAHRHITGLTFTGSSPVGQTLLSQGGCVSRKFFLELGGNAACLILESADLHAAANNLVAVKCRCSGQTCIAPNRILVQASVHDEFVELLHERISKLVVGEGRQEATQITTLINAAATQKLEALVKSSVEMGADLRLGGGKLHRKAAAVGEEADLSKGHFFEPTLITNCRNDHPICQTENFGPIFPVIKFETEQDGVAMANDTEFGLAGYFFSQDFRQQIRVAESLQAGMIGVNDCFISRVEIPFGGVKHSGVGREGGFEAISEYTHTKYVALGL